MQAKMKFSKRVASLATALVTGLSAAGVTSIPVEGFVTLSASADGHEYVNGFCTEESCDAPYEQPGTDDSGVYQIENAGQLYWFSDFVNTKGEGDEYPNVGANAVLTADITVNEGDVAGCDGEKAEGWRDWTPIGKANEAFTGADIFSGTFDGQGHTISGLYHKAESDENDGADETRNDIGLFGAARGNSIIQNVGVVNSYFKGFRSIGGIIGMTYDNVTIQNCYSKSTLSGVYDVAGICGVPFNNTIIQNCYSMSTMVGQKYVGGICSDIDDENQILNCYSVSKIEAQDGMKYAGGIVWRSSGTIDHCYYNSDVFSGEAYYDWKGEKVENETGSAKTTDQFQSGEVCYLLNGDQSEIIFYQTLGEDDLPVLDSTHKVVYANTDCDGSVLSCNNVSGVVRSDHDWDENGFCKNDPTHYQEPEQVNGVYQIANAGQLYWFAAYVNTYADATYPNVGANAVLTADIVVNEGDVAGCDGEKAEGWREWTPIGTGWEWYAGAFDGQGHTISGLYFNDTDTDTGKYVGIFGKLQDAGTIQNVGVKNSYFKGSNYIGGICGSNYKSGTIRNCYSEANLTGVVAKNSGIDIGGVVGENDGKIENCYNTGKVTGNRWVGGVCGFNDGENVNCYNIGEVTGTSDVGGVYGQNNGGTITNCYYLADSEVSNDDGTFAKTAEQFKSGEVAYLLNGSTPGDANIFRQNLDNGEPADALPVLDSTHGVVYSGTLCTGDSGYTNDGDSTGAIHAWDDNGFCTRDDTHYQPAVKNTENVYEISNAGQLYWFAAQVSSRQIIYADAVLTTDITVNEGDLTNYDGTSANTWRTWTPINGSHYISTFDGQGHVIRGLYFNNTDVGNIGLFADLYDDGKIQNVGLENAYIRGLVTVGSICAVNSGSIENCYNAGTIVAEEGHVGGLVANNYSSGSIVNCYNTGNITVGSNIGGGIVAWNFSGGTIKNCYNTGTLTGGGMNGVVKSNDGTVENCYYLADSESDNGNGTFGKTADQFAGGEVCYLLNGNQSNIVFYQNTSTEAYPTLNADSKQVYRLELTYDESFGEDAATETTYHNAGDAIELEASPDKAYTYQYFKGEEQLVESHTLTGDTAITVKKVPVEIELSEEFDAVFLLTYQKALGSLDLTEFVTNFANLKPIQFKLDADSALPEGLTLTEDGVLSGTPEKAADAVKTTLILTAGNGASRRATLTFRIAKADPTVEVTVDGKSHTEGDLVSELELRLSENSTKGTVKIISEIKALAAGKNTLMWEFTPEDSDNYYTATGTVIVNAQTTTTTTKETTSTTKESTTTSKTTATTKASTSTSKTTATTKASASASKTTATTKASTSASKTTATTKASTSSSKTTATTKASASASGTTATTKASASASGTTATTKASASTSGTTATTKASASASGTTATTKASASTSKTTATTKASASASGTTATTKVSASTSGTTATTKVSASTSGTTVTTKASASASNVGSTSETNSTVTGTASSVTETTTESTMQTTQTTLTTESATTATSLTTASSATSKTNIADEDLCSWAINDYQKKTGITPANAEITSRSEDAYEITLTDENGNVLDIYTVDPKTGTGTDSSNAEVNLPQTGNNAMTNWIVFFGAVLFLGFGFGAVKASGVLKRKEEE